MVRIYEYCSIYMYWTAASFMLLLFIQVNVQINHVTIISILTTYVMYPAYYNIVTM